MIFIETDVQINREIRTADNLKWKLASIEGECTATKIHDRYTFLHGEWYNGRLLFRCCEWTNYHDRIDEWLNGKITEAPSSAPTRFCVGHL